MKFRNKTLEKQFYKDGYVIFDLLQKTSVEELHNFYTQSLSGVVYEPESNHSSCDIPNKQLIVQIHNTIKKHVEPRLSELFESYEYLLSSFLTKEPGNGNITGFHQDPTMVENDDLISAGIWCPLQQTNTNNGCLKLIPGSHRLGNILAVSPNFTTIFNRFEENLDYFSIPIELKAGQAVMFNNKLIHGAFPNSSSKKRIAVVTAVKSADCRWVYFHKNQDNLVGKYRMNFEDYAIHNHGMEPRAELIGTVDHHFEEISMATFLKFMLVNYPKQTIRQTMNWIFNRSCY